MYEKNRKAIGEKSYRVNSLSFFSNVKSELVYVIGLHAVQFGNNWIQKIPRTAKLAVLGIF